MEHHQRALFSRYSHEGRTAGRPRSQEWPCERGSKDPAEIVNSIKNFAVSFGGINLEDIAAPECFIIEENLKKILDIPVFHDDQHGTAIITSAALINSIHITKKNISKVKVVVNGAGASAMACSNLFLKLGVKKKI